MSYPFLNRNPPNTSAGKSPSAMFNTFKTIFIDRLIDGKEKVSLLEAPPIGKKPQWKLHSFLQYKKKLRLKLELYSAAAIISVSWKGFDVNTHVANDQTEDYVKKIKTAFGNIFTSSRLVGSIKKAKM